MNTLAKSIYATAALAAVVLVSSCSDGAKIVGSWTSSSATDVADAIPAASTASARFSIDFMSGDNDKQGPVSLSALIDASQAVEGDTAFVDPYEVTVAATASVGGTWAYKDDDIQLSLDLNTLSVNVDPYGVALSDNIMTGAQKPLTDSLTTATAERWKAQLTTAMKAKLIEYQNLDNVKVSDNNTLSFEVKNSAGKSVKEVFRRVINAD